MESPSPKSTDSTQSQPAGFNCLPPEIRLKIYREVWEPRTVVSSFELRDIDHDPSPRHPKALERALEHQRKRKPPVTLHINYEARQQMLMHYHRYQLQYYDVESVISDHLGSPNTFSRPTKKETFGYFNPYLDIFHFEHLYSRQGLFPPGFSLLIPTIREPLLRISLGRDIKDDILLGGRLEDLIPLIRTIDFFLDDGRPHRPQTRF
ncbi:hypothetical protein B0T21DRAFT_414496 [Apiosordaria backusii]|uniref:2EXR domain-containing protein n=1 Tax=Apiosordaria backusii TaxID=314023 RepID=A0AA40ASV2_9PEZI|nr:hypothetical protein B0T21DRAFT_414496 [Apiosordaria backusii]